MQAEQKQFQTFEDLEVYQVAREFRKAMYLRERKAGASLTLHETSPGYGLTDDDLEVILDDSTI